VSLALLLKVSYAFLGMPALFLFWHKYDRRLLAAWEPWLFAGVTLVPSVLWYRHAYELFLDYANTFGIFAAGYVKFATVSLLTSPAFYIRTAARIVLFHVTPVGALLALAGIGRRVERPLERLLAVWLGAVCLLLLVAAQGVDLGHYQYALPILPPLAIYAGAGFARLWRHIGTQPLTMPRPSIALAGVAIVLVLANGAAANVLFRVRGSEFRQRSAAKMATGRALAALTPPGSLIVVVDADMDGRTPERSMTPPEVFYFADRRGWYRSMAWLDDRSIDDLRARGASYLAVSANDLDIFRTRYHSLAETWARRYAVLLDGPGGIVYDLTRPAAYGEAR
jgi:4-amino-4-deoxy-L-arabinose transferase-like glycosyltransferase